MASSISVTVKGLASLRAKVAAHQKKVSAAQVRALKIGAVMIHSDAVKSIQKGPKTGILYGELRYVRLANFGVAIPASKMRKLHRASAPGEAPATDTGNLVRNIGFNVDASNKSATVTSRARYSAALEFGTNDGKILPRPFMNPAYVKNLPAIQTLFREAANG